MTEKRGILFLPAGERPREKLFKFGEHRLSDAELLAILLRTGTAGTSALDMARAVLSRFKTFRQMSHTDIRDWKRFKGLGPAKLAQIRAALEIARRVNEEVLERDDEQIKSSAQAARRLMPRLRDLKTEVFKVIFLDSQNRVLAIDEICEGTVNSTAPVIREIFHRALQHFAAAVICAHNHPSGETRPSRQDEMFTRRLREAGDVLKVKVLDHIIIGDNRYYSFADEGRL